MNVSLDDLRKLASELQSLPDRRPDHLKALPHATESTALYYRFLYELSLRYAPRALEIGTYVGTSAAHLAANQVSKVVTVDINPDAKSRVDAIGLGNIVAVTLSSHLYWERLRNEPEPFDLVFIDGNHTFNDAYGEYEKFRPFAAQGGIMLFDDIKLPMATHEMEIFWDMILDPKVELPELHYTGFGVVKIDRAVRVPSWTEVIEAATRRMRPDG